MTCNKEIKNIHLFGFSALYGTIKNTGVNIQKSSHGRPSEPKKIKYIKSMKIRDEPTNKDVV